MLVFERGIVALGAEKGQQRGSSKIVGWRLIGWDPETRLILPSPRVEVGGAQAGVPVLLRGRLLLSHAVERAQAEDQVAAGDAYYFAIRKEIGQRVQGCAIVGVVEGWDDYQFTGYVKVCVAGGKTLVVEIDWGGHGESFDAEWAAVVIFHGAE